MMRWSTGRAMACGLLAATVGWSAAGLRSAGAQTAVAFPFDRELLLDAAPMRPSKRLPSITVARDGRATIDLWCRSVTGQVALGEGTLTVTVDIQPQDLAQQPPPAMQGPGQCNEARERADAALLDALIQATGWRQQNEAVLLTGAGLSLRFQPATN